MSNTKGYDAYRKHELTWSRYFHYGLFDGTDDLERAQEIAIDRFASLGGISGTTEVLDVGCGIASTPIYLARTYGCRVVGIDPVASQIAYGHDRVEAALLAGRVMLTQGSAEAIPAADSSFDVVLVNEVLCLVHDKARALSEVHRVLRPGGRLVISDLYDSADGRATAFFHQAMHHVTPMATFDEYIAAIRSCGFELRHTFDHKSAVGKSYRAALDRLSAQPDTGVVSRGEIDIVRSFYEYCVSDQVCDAIGWAHYVATKPNDVAVAPNALTEVSGAEVERLLAELEALDEDSAVERLQIASGERALGPEAAAARDTFGCPAERSTWFGRRRCNLVILLHDHFERETFDRIARHVRALDPLIDAVVIRDRPDTPPPIADHPTLTFAPAIVRYRYPGLGRTFCGYPLSKSQECEVLDRAGIPVPRWVLLTESSAPDLQSFDKYVVTKPDRGARGAAVKVVRKSRVRWEPTSTRASGISENVIVQELIHTGEHPVSYRVNTLFGRVLYSVRYDRPSTARRVTHPTDPNAEPAWGSIVASPRGSKVTLNWDADIIRLGEQAAAAFPDFPLLGIDVIREASTGRLYVLEANSIGFVWNFGSTKAADWGLSFEAQFDGIRKAAYVLAEKTQQDAL